MNQKTIVLFHNLYYADSIIPRLKEIDFLCQYKHIQIGRRNGKINMLYNWLLNQYSSFYLAQNSSKEMIHHKNTDYN